MDFFLDRVKNIYFMVPYVDDLNFNTSGQPYNCSEIINNDYRVVLPIDNFLVSTILPIVVIYNGT